jgi:hypothetical protein
MIKEAGTVFHFATTRGILCEPIEGTIFRVLNDSDILVVTCRECIDLLRTRI